ncbi:unnamed protein product [Toxocara canis]|uniref:Ricin B-type lectin domain-containing protein n=1 Tax=Toxocara canis TaxID=6265 RepID=A0A183UMH2_TOXCA|nr:unnamed protein product [Toxocara canis]
MGALIPVQFCDSGPSWVPVETLARVWTPVESATKLYHKSSECLLNVAVAAQWASELELGRCERWSAGGAAYNSQAWQQPTAYANPTQRFVCSLGLRGAPHQFGGVLFNESYVTREYRHHKLHTWAVTDSTSA